jgi:hypothetical protein
MTHRTLSALPWVWVAALMPAATDLSRAGTVGPRASFALEHGWVQVQVRQEKGPVADARIRVFDDAEQVFAEGETDEQGVGSFPARGHTCRIGITINGKECDLIPLHLDGKTAEPARVLLTFGTRPCCRMAAGIRGWTGPEENSANQESESPPPAPEVGWPALAGGGCLAAAGALVVVFRRRKLRPAS